MKRIACLLAWTIAVPCVEAADWIKISSANFEILTDAAESEARKTLATFRRYAEEAGTAARRPDEKAAAERMLAQIQQVTSDGPLLAVPTSPDSDSERPILRRGRPTPKKP